MYGTDFHYCMNENKDSAKLKREINQEKEEKRGEGLRAKGLRDS